jgi:hypothetical protein
MNVRTPINAVIQCRESRDKGNNTHDKAWDRGGGAKKSALKKSSKSLPIKVSMQEDETSTNTDKKKGEKPQAAEKEGKYEVNLEAMSKTPLKEKGKKGEAKQKKKNVTSEEVDNQTKTRKKATFAKTVEREASQTQRIDYKKCVVGFAIRVDKGNNMKGGFDKKIIKGLNFMQTYIDKHASFHLIGKDQTTKPIREKTDMPKY